MALIIEVKLLPNYNERLGPLKMLALTLSTIL